MDVTLGYYYYRIERMNERNLYNPFDREDVERYFDGPYKAMSHAQWCDLNGVKKFFGILPPGAYDLRARSSWARNGVAVCFDAGWVDPGYINRLTLEIYNLNHRETVVLPVGV